MSNPVPMFSRRHYEAIAAVLAMLRVYNPPKADAPYDCDIRLGNVAVNLADLFQGDNPRFNRSRFLKACGLE